MASLLERAGQVQERLREKAEIEAIPAAEREKIYNEIDRAVSLNKLRIQKNTFSFKPTRSDVKLPVIINISAFLLIAGLSTFFFFYFNQAETVIVSEIKNVVTAEGRLLQALREESEQKLGEKEREIRNIQGKLEDIRLEQENLIADSLEQARQLETDLRQSFEKELEDERRRLQNEGLSVESVEQKLQEFEAQKQLEFHNQIDSMKKQLEEERLAKEQSLNNLITDYEQNLDTARTDRLAMEEELKQQYSEKAQQLESERDTAVAKMVRFDELQKQEQLVIDQIFSMYSSMNDFIRNSQHDRALENLDNLEKFLNEDNIAELPAIQDRREVDFFMIRSLRRLIEVENDQNEPDTDSLTESANILAIVSGIVEEGNRLYDLGDLEAARESYLRAISRFPALDTGFTKLKSIEKQDLEQEREMFVRNLSDGDKYFSSREFESAIDKYRQALEYLEDDSDIVDKIISRLTDAGRGIETSGDTTLIAPEDLALLNQAKLEKEKRADLIDELDTIEKQYTDFPGETKNDSDSRETLVSLLNTKLLIKEVLASDPIQEEYPDLHEKMGLYLDAYGQEKEKEGRDAALKEIVAITEYLSQEAGQKDGSGGSGISITTPEEEKQRELFLQFLQNLKGLLELGG